MIFFLPHFSIRHVDIHTYADGKTLNRTMTWRLFHRWFYFALLSHFVVLPGRLSHLLKLISWKWLSTLYLQWFISDLPDECFSPKSQANLKPILKLWDAKFMKEAALLYPSRYDTSDAQCLHLSCLKELNICTKCSGSGRTFRGLLELVWKCRR